jgi:RNA polymerase sigma factor (sigma-70 family)
MRQCTISASPAWTPVQVLSFEDLAGRANGPDEVLGGYLIDDQPRPDECAEREEATQAVAAFCCSLSTREREIVRRVFWDDETQSTVAKTFGVSKMAISKAVARIMKRGRAELAALEHSALFD